MGKAIARKSHKTIAKEALKDATTKKCIMNILGKELAREIKAMASDRVTSILQSQNPNHLKQFQWDMLLDELSRYAPQLKSLLLSATKLRVPRSNTAAVVGMCAAMLINHRYPNMNLPQKIEGDGDWVLRCWRYMIPMFAASGNYKYACEAANLVLQHSYTRIFFALYSSEVKE